MKKTLLALAITALSANAFAVNLDTAADTQVFAQEIKVASTGTEIGGTAVTASVKAGFALNSGFVRFDLTNGAKFKTNPSLVVGAQAANTTPAAGGAGQSFVIYNVGAAIAAADVVALTTTTTGITVVNKSAVGISYGLYETAGAASNQTGNLNAKSGTLISFAPALAVKATPGTSLKIDAIGAESKKFAGGLLTSPLTTLTAGVVAAPIPLKADGSGAVAYADIVASEKWVLNGNFSAVAAAGLNGGATVGTIAADKASVTYSATPAAAVTYTVTGANEIAETTVSAVYTPVATANYEAAPVTVANAAKLEKNGTTQAVDLALKPGGTYSNFVRVTNKDTISGAFFIKVINDAGKAVSFPLNAVTGQPATLTSGASTTQMSIQSIYDAAVAKDATFATSGEGKLRLEVTGQTNGLSVQSYTVSKDGNSFATF